MDETALERLKVALEMAGPGAFVFVEMDDPEGRAELPDRVLEAGLKRTYLRVDFERDAWTRRAPGDAAASSEALGLIPGKAYLPRFLRALMQEVAQEARKPDLLYLDGLEGQLAEDEALEAFNLSREDLTGLPVVLVFECTSTLVDRIRSRAMNFWSWRAFHVVFGSSPERRPQVAPDRELLLGPAPAVGDTPAARERRMRIAQRLLEEDEKRGMPHSASWTIIRPLAKDLTHGGRHEEAAALLRSVGPLGHPGDEVVRATDLAGVLRELGQVHEARALIESAAQTIATLTGEVFAHLRPEVEYAAARLCEDDGDYVRAERHFLDAITGFDRLGGKTFGELSRISLAHMNSVWGKLGRAERLFTEIQRRIEQHHAYDGALLALLFRRLSAHRWRQGRRAEAVEFAVRGVAAARTAGTARHWLPDTLWLLAQELGETGDWAGARDALHELTEVQASLGWERWVAFKSLGVAAFNVGDIDSAARHIEDALRLARSTHDTAAEPELLRDLANVEMRRGHYSQAEGALRKALKLLAGDPAKREPTALCLTDLAAALHALNRSVEANAFEDQAAVLQAEIGPTAEPADPFARFSGPTLWLPKTTPQIVTVAARVAPSPRPPGSKRKRRK